MKSHLSVPLAMPFDRVVFDTNIWVSFFLNAQFDRLVKIAIGHDLTLVSSPVLFAELKEVLSRPKFNRYLTLPIDEYLDFHQNLVKMLVTNPVFSQSPDLKDNFLFDLAIQSKGNLIVTGDKKLLAVSPLEGVRIVPLTAFLSDLKS